jgi:hypothetical protein
VGRGDRVGINVTEEGFAVTVGLAVGGGGTWVGDDDGGSVGGRVGVSLGASAGLGVGRLVVGLSVEAMGRNVGRRVGAVGLETGVGVTTMVVGADGDDCDSTKTSPGDSVKREKRGMDRFIVRHVCKEHFFIEVIKEETYHRTIAVSEEEIRWKPTK